MTAPLDDARHEYLNNELSCQVNDAICDVTQKRSMYPYKCAQQFGSGNYFKHRKIVSEI